MERALAAEFSESDILFLVETADPALLSKIDTIKDDTDIIEGMMEHEARRIPRLTEKSPSLVKKYQRKLEVRWKQVEE